jgi:hypothetical protein
MCILNIVLCREVRVHQIVYEAENVLTPKGNFIFVLPNFRLHVEYLCIIQKKPAPYQNCYCSYKIKTLRFHICSIPLITYKK